MRYFEQLIGEYSGQQHPDHQRDQGVKQTDAQFVQVIQQRQRGFVGFTADGLPR